MNIKPPPVYNRLKLTGYALRRSRVPTLIVCYSVSVSGELQERETSHDALLNSEVSDIIKRIRTRFNVKLRPR